MASKKIQIQGDISGTFSKPSGGTNNVEADNPKNLFTWGEGQNGSSPSSLTFTGASFNTNVLIGEGIVGLPQEFLKPLEVGYTYGEKQNRDPDNSEDRDKLELFSLGTLSYFNGEIKSGTGASSVSLDITAKVTDPLATTTFSYQLNLNNTTNIENDKEASADYVDFPSEYFPRNTSGVALKTSSGASLALKIEGFGKIEGGGFVAQEGNEFRVYEGESASAELIGRFVDPIESIIKDAVKPDVIPTENNLIFPDIKATMKATFTPNFGLTLDEAAKLLGFDHFNWFQVVLKDPALKFPNEGNKPLSNRDGQELSAPYVDSPLGGYRGGSYTDDKGNVKYPGLLDDNLPFYLDEDAPDDYDSYYKQQISSDGKTLSTKDTPNAEYYSKYPNQYTEFQTSLVGVFSDGSWQVLRTFGWKSNYTGSGEGEVILLSPRNTSSSKSSSVKGGVFDLKTDLSPSDVPAAVRRLMQANGAVNASGTAATPLASIDFSGGKRGRKLNGTNRSDTVRGTGKNDTLNGKNGKDQLLSKGGNDRVLGNGGNDKLTCGGGNDRAFGDSGKDTINGDSGNDQLQGGTGNDRLSGGGGNDVLIGNQGKDTLTGGSGRDSFTFVHVNDRVDTITDFTLGVDLIDLRQIFTSPLFTGVDIFSQFTEFLQLVQLGSNTQIQIDADGAGAGTTFIPLVILKNILTDNIDSRSFVIG